MPRIHFDGFAQTDTPDQQPTGDRSFEARDRRRRRDRAHRRPHGESPGPSTRPRHRDDGQESFKCGHCRAFIGPTVSGGRHRNHCPICLYSRHVDDKRPGDRASSCRSLMAPVATFFRPKGEQVILHRCLGCGLERYNRVAADDNILACQNLPVIEPRLSGPVDLAAEPEDEANL